MPRFDFEGLSYSAGIIVDPVIAFLLESVCEKIAMAGKLSATASNQIELLQKLGIKFNTIEAELTKRLKRSRKDLDQLFRDYAAEHYAADYERLKLSYVPFEENASLQQIVAAHVKLAQDDLFNATQTKGGKVKLSLMDGSGRKIGQGKVLPWREFYVNVCDDVNVKVVTGAMSYNQAVHEASRNLSEKGIMYIPYESGRSISLEAGIRRNVMVRPDRSLLKVA